MIHYMTRDKERTELEMVLGLATSVWPLDPAGRIERDAASIATAMASIHGGEWRFQIDHLAGFVLIVPH